jgi:hypothetical protein
MLLIQRAIAGDTKKHKAYDDELGYNTPILKCFITELVIRVCKLGHASVWWTWLYS